jgi:hypothetical protein
MFRAATLSLLLAKMVNRRSLEQGLLLPLTLPAARFPGASSKEL